MSHPRSISNHLTWSQQGLIFDPLGHTHHRNITGQMRSDRLPCRPNKLRWNGAHHHRCAVERPRAVMLKSHGWVNHQPGHTGRTSRTRKFFNHCRKRAPNAHRHAALREHCREHHAHLALANNSYTFSARQRIGIMCTRALLCVGVILRQTSPPLVAAGRTAPCWRRNHRR